MKITIIRHGKVNMQWKKWYTSKQFDLACANYDISPLYPMHETENAVSCDIYISTLKRSKETAEHLFGKKEFIETKLLNEVPLKSFCDCNIPLPLCFFNIIGRAQWFFQSRRQPERRQDTKKRADELIALLLQKNRDCVLISHGFFMQTFIKELKQSEFRIDKKSLAFANLEKITAIK